LTGRRSARVEPSGDRGLVAWRQMQAELGAAPKKILRIACPFPGPGVFEFRSADIAWQMDNEEGNTAQAQVEKILRRDAK